MSRSFYTYSIFKDTEMPADIVPCKTPCVPRGMLGMSWWKVNGFNTDCSCAYEAEFKKPFPPTDSIVCDECCQVVLREQICIGENWEGCLRCYRFTHNIEEIPVVKAKKPRKSRAKVTLIIEDTPAETLAIKVTNNFNKLLLRSAFEKMKNNDDETEVCEECGITEKDCETELGLSQYEGRTLCPDCVPCDDEPKYYLANGCIGKNFYKDWIKNAVSKATQKKFEALLKDEDEDFIEYYRVGISNPDDKAWEFSSLWFFDINLDKGYMPVFLSGVNTSSALAMEMCGIDRDDEDGEDNGRTLEELLEYAPNGSEQSKGAIKKYLLMKK